MKKRIVNDDDAFETKPGARKARPQSSQIVRMQVSFVLPDGMTRETAVKFAFVAIRDAADAAELPSLEELQVIAFKKGFKT